MPRWPKKAEPLTDEQKLAKIKAIVTDPEVRRVRYRREMVDRIRRVLADEPEPSIVVETPEADGEPVETSKAQGSWLPDGPIAPYTGPPAGEPAAGTAEPAPEPADEPATGESTSEASRDW